ncbi:cryptochrome/photolyase family protein [Alteromonas oceanisediminis]|uniref:cryptochrome/photolyase family protein n=1 Tax=Alteromonas oceanisediminis TaxID=2836180 RepID=UPI001BD961E0|nr:cryptochrome/photolyase family protein [Alteromonas oceanisediminis]MBT0587103.1 cryptochrome/photolyase family protein [Alteromonas oceanisediminis]
MATLRLVLGDQLRDDISALQGINKETDFVLMAEVNAEASYVKHHKKKIAFLFSAMRHFARSLRDDGYNVTYIDYDHKHNKGALFKQVQWFCEKHAVDDVVVTHPGEHRLLQDMQAWQDTLDKPVEIRADNRFLVSQDFFADWAEGKKQYRMEFFYREVRKKTGYLMEAGEPAGGKWNYDSQNREPMPKNHSVPDPTTFKPDDETQAVIDLVAKHFDDHFGSLENFHFAVTRNDALVVLNEFIEQRLPDFGQYQDAMVTGEPWMFHSHISFYLNCGLLRVEEVVEQAIIAYDSGQAPLNSVEGFVRQVIGWREYIRGFYWYFMPDLASQNALQATRKLPELFWTADTDMFCLQQCVQETKDNAYAHHIQRLMVLGNFLLLSGVDPKWVNEWYLIVYADAYEWVEMPNVSSMILYADDGMLASKPYAASGSYINKMSDYCKNCHYSVKEKTGTQACPFNYLYWHFIDRHKEKLQDNPRMAMIYRTLSKMDPKQVQHMLEDADAFLSKLDANEKV